MAGPGHNKPPKATPGGLSPSDREKLKDAIQQLDDSMTTVASERLLQKEIVDNISEEIGIEKKMVRKLAKTHFKANFKNEEEDFKDFADFYEMLMNKVGVS